MQVVLMNCKVDYDDDLENQQDDKLMNISNYDQMIHHRNGLGNMQFLVQFQMELLM